MPELHSGASLDDQPPLGDRMEVEKRSPHLGHNSRVGSRPLESMKVNSLGDRLRCISFGSSRLRHHNVHSIDSYAVLRFSSVLRVWT